MINTIVTWVQSNWADITVLYFATVGFASAIVKLTPTQKDDALLKKVTDFMSKYIALNK